MAQLVGADRRAIVDRLVDQFDAVAAGHGPRAVSLESSLGLGKTRLVQELYGRLATTRQGSVAYWPSALDWREHAGGDARRDILQARRQVEPTPGWVVPGGVEIPWLWWGITCQLTNAGSPMRALKDGSDQLRAHLDPLLAKLERSNRNRDDALEVLTGVFDLVGVVNPGSAVEAGSKFLGVFRRRRQQNRQLDAISMDRRVDTHGESYAEATRIAEGLTAVARAKTPVILAIDDAQWADPALVSLLRHLIGLENAPVLIVTTAWPEKLLEQADRGAGSFAGWLQATEASRADRLERLTLERLDDASLGEIVLQTASRTPQSTVEGIAAIASGNPLVLNLLLDLDVVRRDVAADGRIDTDPGELARLPSNLRAIYQDLWRQLPEPVRRALALVAVQGPEFLPGFVEDAATRLAMYEQLVPAFVAARDVHRWIRPVNDDRYEFVERQRFDVADDVLREVFDERALNLIREAIVAHILDIKAAERWPDLDLRTRRVALESHLDANEQLGSQADRDLAALADSMVQLAALELGAGSPGRAVELAQRSLVLIGEANVDPMAGTQAREVLAQALTAAGRADEAVPVLASLLAIRDEAAPEAKEVAELLAEIQAEAAAETAAAGRVVPEGQSAAPAPSPEPPAGVDEWGREPWSGWTARPVPVLTDLPPSEVGALVTEVVAAEGPVYAARIYDLLRVASGAGRLGRQIRAALDGGVRSAVRRGNLVASVPDAAGDSGRRILRLPTQPGVLLRQLGDRTVDLVPPGELAELGRRVSARHPRLTRDELKHRLVPLLGGTNLGRSLDQLLEAALPATLGAEAVPPRELDEWGRLPWVGWRVHEVPALVGLKPAQVAPLILEVVEAEGPVLIGRAFELLRQASGAGRMSRTLHDVLEAGANAAERQGKLVRERGRRGSPDSRTLRLPEQPEVLLRTPGDRDARSIPPAELAELGRRVLERAPDLGREDLKRQVAGILGWTRYTALVNELLESALPGDLQAGRSQIAATAPAPMSSRVMVPPGTR